ncbi:hypothetical protein Tsubulata_049139, partial [Turnera subulata]
IPPSHIPHPEVPLLGGLLLPIVALKTLQNFRSKSPSLKFSSSRKKKHLQTLSFLFVS